MLNQDALRGQSLTSWSPSPFCESPAYPGLVLLNSTGFLGAGGHQYFLPGSSFFFGPQSICDRLSRIEPNRTLPALSKHPPYGFFFPSLGMADAVGFPLFARNIR